MTRPRLRHGFTLIEVLVATTLTLMMIGAVVSVFEMVSNSVSDSRSALEMGDRLRATTMQLQRDLAGVTVTMLPPRRPEDNEGYFEFVENTVLARSGSLVRPTNAPISAPNPVVIPVNVENGNADDLTVADHDDILMFTTRSLDRAFIGRFGSTGNAIESQVVEVAWFVRGRTLYRRVLLVVPGVPLPAGAVPRGFYGNYDLSVRSDPTNPNRLVPNTLGDLTKRENRFAHPCLGSQLAQNRPPFPYDVRNWGLARLPTCAETSSGLWQACLMMPVATNNPGVPAPSIPNRASEDLWSGADGIVADNAGQINAAWAVANQYRLPNPYDPSFLERSLTTNATFRASDDVILTNVIGFDVKVWDPGAPLFGRTVAGRSIALAPGDPGYPSPGDSATAGTNLGRPVGYGAYVDLGYYPNCPYTAGTPRPQFHVVNYDGTGSAPQSRLQRIYDTWSTHYESDGIAQIGGKTDWATDGFDNDGRNGVDDPGERETIPPYPFPLRSIQVKIRCFDPDSRQIRETTIVQDFLP